ncbi:pyridoxamine 5'-phosphate oxidase family protein [Agromyces sp. SYSU T00194]|uniref:pyridoxamine 5'-phosphate oxidase family protein n=1 Tax=Agromyces chitinivorans TaxID=3158560 RepID=UPI0033978F9E
MADNGGPIVELSAEECWALLVENELGRLAVSIADQPEIFPVNYAAADGGILIRTAEGTKLFGVTVNHRVAFEIDDRSEHEGWSVVAKGNARTLEHEDEIAAAEQEPLTPWIATVKRNFVRIEIDELTGRRVRFGAEPEPDYTI